MPNINYDLFFVEVIWPSREKRRPVTEDDFARYNVTAFNDRRNPGTRKFFSSTVGTFDKENADVADVPERCKEGGAGFSQFRDIAAFTTEEAALAYAERLNEFGELAAVQDHHGQNYVGPLQVRVMHETISTARTVVHRLKKRKLEPKDLLDQIPDEVLRHIADAKDVGSVRERIRNAMKGVTA